MSGLEISSRTYYNNNIIVPLQRNQIPSGPKKYPKHASGRDHVNFRSPSSRAESNIAPDLTR